MKKWIEYNPISANGKKSPPVMELSWFADSGNVRNPRPHVRLTAWACENTGSCRYWMPYNEGDEEPPLPEEIMKDAARGN